MRIRVAKNAAWNIIGVSLPLLAGLLAVPLLLHGLGQAKLGIFSLALGLFGFSGLFDLGLGRAITQTIASEQGKGAHLNAIAGLIRRGLLVVGVMGLVWGLILYGTAFFIAHDLFHLPGQLAHETQSGFQWLAFALPFVLLSTSLIGILEGLQQFRATNLLRAPIGAATFLIPATTAQFTNHLDMVLASLAATRIVASLLWLALTMRVFPIVSTHNGTPLSAAHMWRFTGWLTVSNLVSPLMVHADRFYLASIFPPSLVALYTVPLDALVRATILPNAAMNAAFPALAHLDAQTQQDTNPNAARNLVAGAGFLMLFFWFLPILIFGIFLYQLLTFWLGAAFAQQIITITQWLLLGVLVNGYAHIPFALIQSAGRADLTAKLHLIELPIYAAVFIIATHQFGIIGAAIAWFSRVLLDMTALFLVAVVKFPDLRKTLGLLLSLTLLTLLALSSIFFLHH